MNPRNAPARLATLAILPALFFSSCSKHVVVGPNAVATPPPQPIIVPLLPQAAPTPDISSPKKVSLEFANAVAAGDVARMRSLAVGTDSHLFAFYSAFADVVASQHIFVAALKTRFGDDCEVPPEIEHLGNLPSMPSNYDQLTERISGDTATLVDTNGHDGVKLRKVGGTWKVDFDAQEAALPPGTPANLDKSLPEFAAMKKIFAQAAAKVFDGTYTDCKTATDAVKAAITAPPHS